MNKVFNFTDGEFISMLNIILEKETPGNMVYRPLESMDAIIDLDILDSLGILVFFVWLSELFGIPDDVVTKFMEGNTEYSIKSIKDFVMNNHTTNHSWDDAKEYISACL